MRICSGEMGAIANFSPPPGQWVPVGPNPLGGCMAAGSTCSGRVTALAVDPVHTGTIYLGGAQGGVWKTTDYGSTWAPLTDGQASLAIGAITIDSSGTVYAGTGEGNGSCDSYYGAGILKSSDGGINWVRLGSLTFGRSSITKIIVNPNNSSIVLASTTIGYASSSTEACPSVAPGVPLGVYRSIDGGNTWTRTLIANRQATDLAFNTANANIVYAAVDGHIYQSPDGGSSWTGPFGGGLPPVGIGRIALGTSTASPQTLMAALQAGPEGYLWRSSDSGLAWSQVPTPPGPQLLSYCHGQCFYNLYVALDPTTTNTIFLGGLDLYRSTDAGITWTDIGGYSGGQTWDSRTGIISGTLVPSIHPDQHAFAFDPTSSTVYVGNDGGVWSSSSADTCDPAVCWADLNLGLQLTQFQSIASHPTDGNIFFGGTQDNGSPLHAGQGLQWNIAVQGDGGWTAFDRSKPLTMYHTFYSMSPQRSDDGGTTWKDITSGIQEGTNCVPSQCQFYIPMAMDPSTPTTLYLGTYRLYWTTNRGEPWMLLSPGLDLRALSLNDVISAITVAPSNGLYVYVGTNLGRLFVSSDGGASFTERDAGFPLGNFTSKIAVDPTNPQRVFATFTSFNAKRVLTSGDAGANWHDITANLPLLPVNSVILSPTGGSIYLGTDSGVWVASNETGTVSWSLFGRGLPGAAVYDLVFTTAGDLLAATHGRGAWKLSFGHDVSVANVIASRSFAYTGIYSSVRFDPRPIKINVTIFNLGTFPEPFNVVETANSSAIGTQSLTLKPGASTVITANFDTRSVANGNYTIVAIVMLAAGEQNLGSSTLAMGGSLQVRKAGDVDADGTVDVTDVIAEWQHQFTNNLPSVYDINNDGRVDITDLLITWQHQFT